MIDDNTIYTIKIEDIIPNRFQPRERFDEEGLDDLAKSIKEHGVIQPIIVRRLGDKYELISGERRTKASSLAGLTTIPAIIKNVDDKESAKLSLLENLQRKNLTAIEEAKTYKRILQLDNITQDELAKTMGRSQPMVANKLRLLSLPDEVQEALVKNQISERHARSLLTIKDHQAQLMFLDRIKKERLTVRDLDKEIKKYKEENNESNDDSGDMKDKERIMNNNRVNFGGMGLNDYQSGVGNNMFNNIPNNFNNMATPLAENNQQENYDYGDFGDNNTINNPTFPANNTSNFNNSGESLGSMFDGGMGQTYNNVPSNQTDNNLFISQIREDNLPKKENQFLPNFDDDVNSNSTPNFDINSSMNYKEPMENNYQPNFNQPMENNYQPNFNQPNNNLFDKPVDMNNYNSPINQPLNNYNEINNQGFNQMNQNNFYQNQNYQSNQNYQPSIDNREINNNPMNYEPVMPMENQPYNSLPNNDYSMNMNDNYNTNNNINTIPDYGYNERDNYNSNNGNLFNQPLNIVGQDEPLPKNNTYGAPITPVEQPLNFNEQQSINNLEQPLPDGDNYNNENISFDKEPEETEKDVEEKPIETPDIELIDDDVKSNENINSKKDEYIHLEEERTIHNTQEALLELKKATDKIKHNNIDIETEEIEFDDVYQITIKIKKEEN